MGEKSSVVMKKEDTEEMAVSQALLCKHVDLVWDRRGGPAGKSTGC